MSRLEKITNKPFPEEKYGDTDDFRQTLNNELESIASGMTHLSMRTRPQREKVTAAEKDVLSRQADILNVLAERGILKEEEVIYRKATIKPRSNSRSRTRWKK